MIFSESQDLFAENDREEGGGEGGRRKIFFSTFRHAKSIVLDVSNMQNQITFPYLRWRGLRTYGERTSFSLSSKGEELIRKCGSNMIHAEKQ